MLPAAPTSLAGSARILVAQVVSPSGLPAGSESLDRLVSLLQSAAEASTVDLFALPAFCLGTQAVALEEAVSALQRIARHAGLVAGIVVTESAPRALLVDQSAVLLDSTPADPIPVVETPLGRIAILHETQLRRPGQVRKAVLAGAEILIAPVRSKRNRAADALRAAAVARAYENSCLVLLADGGGWMGDRPAGDSAGLSAVISADGRVVEEAGGPGELLLEVSIDLERLRADRRTPANPLLQLRNEAYRAGEPTPGEVRVADPASAPAPYAICCLQANIRVIDDPAAADEVIAANLQRTRDLVAEAAVGGSRIVVFPEFWLQGFAWGRSIADWQRVSFAIPGPITDELGRIASDHRVYLAGAAFEVDTAWPGRWFTTAFLIGSDGALLLRCRKLQSSNILGQLPDSSPADCLTAYLAHEGSAAIFPVAETPLGRIAVTVSSDLNWPEVGRGFVANGAEILLHAGGSPHTPNGSTFDVIRRARAAELRVVIASANYGRLLQSVHPEEMSRGHSQIIDHTGQVLGFIAGQGEAYIRARVDLRDLRLARLTDTRWQRELSEPPVDRQICPINRWNDQPLADPAESRGVIGEVIERLIRERVLR